MIKRVIKKMGALAISTLMFSSLMVGCSSKANTGDTGSTGDLKPVELKMYLLGDKPKDFDLVYGKVNEIMKKEINATLNVNFLSWADMSTKYQLLFQSGEDFDMIFTAAGWGYYSQVASKNGFAEITEEMLKEYAPNVYANEPEEAWKQAKINGKIYMVPTDRQELGTNVFGVRGDLMAKYGFSSLSNYDELEKFMDAVAAGEKNSGIKVMANGGGQNLQWPYMIEKNGFSTVNGTPSPAIGFDVDDKDGNVFAFVDTPEYLSYAKKMKEFADKGYWAADSISSKATRDEDFVAGKTALMVWNVGTVANKTVEMNKTNAAWDAQLVDLSKGINRVAQPYVNGGVGINANSKNKERALMAIDMLRYNKEINDLTWYGIKDVHYTAAGDNLYTPTADSGNFPAGGVCPWGWYTTEYAMTSTDEPAIVKETLNEWTSEYVVTNPLSAFNFDDSTVKNEMAAVGNVITQYGVPLDLGMVADVEAGIKEYREKLKEAGLDKILAECQKQAKEFVKTYK